jgi:copper chaperone CopZ
MIRTAAIGCSLSALLVACEVRPTTVEVAYAVEGMHCDGCAQAIVAEVSEVKGVRSVKCTFESKQAVIVLDDATSLAEAERAITKLGYTISPAAAATAPAASAQPPASR